jgi:hypothetical protein
LVKNLREALVEDIKPFRSDPRPHPLYERAERAFDNLAVASSTTASPGIRRFLDDRSGHAPLQRQLVGAGGL